MKTIHGYRITASISLPIKDLINALMSSELAGEFQAIAKQSNPEGLQGLPNKKSITLTVRHIDDRSAHEFTFVQHIDQCLGDNITVFYIAPSQGDAKQSFIHPAINERIEPADFLFGIFFDKLYDLIMETREIGT
ncbi:MAG: hypothetical protein V4686_02835 [Patescibacteria group bacterium]